MQNNYTLLGDNSRIPFVGFGTYLISDEDCEQVVGAALDSGYRHIDTAEGYGNEAGIGRAIQSRISRGDLQREELFITCLLYTSPSPRDS